MLPAPDRLPISAICDLYAKLYSTLPTPPGTWDTIIGVDGCYATIANGANGTRYLCFRGSVTFLDWVEDFAMCAQPVFTEKLGGVHPGFLMGVMAVRDRLDAALAGDAPVVIVGHSLGAGHAMIYAGMRGAAGLPVSQLVLFGAPRAGDAVLSDVVRKIPGIKIYNFRNADLQGHDLVTDVPPALPPFTNYCQPTPFIPVDKAPDPRDPWGLFRYHHFGLYAHALGATGEAAKSLPGYA